MLVTQIDDKNYLVKIPFDNDSQYCFDDTEEIMSFFKIIFSKLIKKYKISGDVIIDFYLDDDYGIVLEVFCKKSYGDDINTKIIFHLDCKFLIEVNYFDYIDKDKFLYYYKDKFYIEIEEGLFYDGEIIYDTMDIIDNGIRIRA